MTSSPRASTESAIPVQTDDSTQQYGPSGRLTAHPDNSGSSVSANTVAIPIEELESLRQELSSLRESRDSQAGVVARLSQCVSKETLSERDVKVMSLVMQMSPPEGRVWAGDDDKRSMKRFLASVMETSVSGRLDARATYFYLINKCLDSRTAKAVSLACMSAKSSRPDYEKALDEAEDCLCSMFARSNRSDKFTSRFESDEWYHGISSLRDYHTEFQFMLAEGDALGVHYDRNNQRRLL